MPGGRRGLVAPQNTFLENIIRRCNNQREYENNILLSANHQLYLSVILCMNGTKKNNSIHRNITINHFQCFSVMLYLCNIFGV